MNHVYDVILRRRTVRKFLEKSVPEKILLQLVDAARMAPSSGNVQPCVFIVVTDPKKRSDLFRVIKWQDVHDSIHPPVAHDGPAAYIVVCVDLILRKKGGASDAGAAAENILLAACEQGLGACWIAALNRKKLKKSLRVPHHVHVDSVIGIGYPAEAPSEVEEAQSGIRIWRDANGVLHVPKRRLADICYMNGYIPYPSQAP